MSGMIRTMLQKLKKLSQMKRDELTDIIAACFKPFAATVDSTLSVMLKWCNTGMSLVNDRKSTWSVDEVRALLAESECKTYVSCFYRLILIRFYIQISRLEYHFKTHLRNALPLLKTSLNDLKFIFHKSNMLKQSFVPLMMRKQMLDWLSLLKQS